MKYNLNDKPGLFPLLMYGLQWWIVSIPCVVIMGTIVAKLHFTVIEEQIFYLQKLFAVMGIAVTVQVLFGHRLPLIIGPASVMLIGVIASAASGVPAIYTAVFVGGILLALLGFSGLLSRIQAIFTPRIITVILILIAFTLTPVILKLVLGDATRALSNLSFAFIFVFALILSNKLLKGIWKSTTVLGGIIFGSLIYYWMHGLPVVAGTEQGAELSYLSLFNFPFEFNIGTILSFFFCFIALTINELGSIQAVGHMLGADQMEKRTNRGVGFVGLSNMLSGILGVVGPVDYSMSPGVISATGCASRYTLIPAGIGLLLCAFFPSLVSLLVGIPGVVMGSILLYLMASQLAAGLQMLVNEKAIANFNNGLVIGVPLMIALLLSFAPSEVLEQIPALYRPILGNGFVMGVIAVLIMEHIIFREKSPVQ